MSDTIDLGPDSLVEAKNAGTPDPDVMGIRGWVGPADDADHIRINLTEALDDYVTVRTDQVIDRVRSADPLGPSMVWVKDLASIEWKQSEAREQQVSALEGELADLIADNAEVAGFNLKAGPQQPDGYITTTTVPIVSLSLWSVATYTVTRTMR